jgi:hypothetical protein
MIDDIIAKWSIEMRASDLNRLTVGQLSRMTRAMEWNLQSSFEDFAPMEIGGVEGWR